MCIARYPTTFPHTPIPAGRYVNSTSGVNTPAEPFNPVHDPKRSCNVSAVVAYDCSVIIVKARHSIQLARLPVYGEHRCYQLTDLNETANVADDSPLRRPGHGRVGFLVTDAGWAMCFERQSRPRCTPPADQKRGGFAVTDLMCRF
jgi:hypothetical protein